MFSLAERAKTQRRIEELSENRLEGFTPDYEGLKAVHKYIFQDAYEWAGKTRAEEVTIAGETFTPELLDTWTRRGTDGEIKAYFQGSKTLETEAPIQINRHAAKFDLAEAQGKLDIPKFSELAADMIEDMNYAHIFADGNGRAMRGFLVQLGRSRGINIDLDAHTKEHWISASVLSAEALPDTMISLIEDSASQMTPAQRIEWENSSVKFDPAIRLEEQKGIYQRIVSAIGLGEGRNKVEEVMETDSAPAVDAPALPTLNATQDAPAIKDEIGQDILQSYNNVVNQNAPIETLRETITKGYKTSLDNSIDDFAFYGPNAPKALGAAAALNAGLTSELMTAQAAVDKINQVSPALRADKPKEITTEQMQDLKTSSQDNVYGEAFLTAAARISPTFMRFYMQTQSLVSLLVPSVATEARLPDDQIDASLMKDGELKNTADKLREKIEVIYQNPDQAYSKATELASNPDISPASLRANLNDKPEILGEIKPIKKGMFGRVDERATQSALIDVKNEAKALSASLQHGRRAARKLEDSVSKTISTSIHLPSPELSEALAKFDKNPELTNFGKGYDVDKLYTQGQNILEKTGDITKLSGKHGFGVKPDALENIKKLKSTVQKLETKHVLNKALTKSITPKLGPKL